jgi:hypothetical protein
MESGWQEKTITYNDKSADYDLVVRINQQVNPVLMPLVKKFTRREGINAELAVGTCGISAGALSRKEADVGGFCCPPGKIDRLPDLRFHTLGISPLLVLVHADNPVQSVTYEQAVSLFQGRITNWSELGGKNMPVQPIGMLHCKKRPGHWRLILKGADHFSPDFKVTSSIKDTLSMVASNRGAVGFEIMMNINHSDMKGKLRPLLIDGHDPLDLERLANGKYPFYRTLNVTTWEGKLLANSHAVKLVEFMIKEMQVTDPAEGVLSSSELKNAGWKFKGDELVGEPE